MTGELELYPCAGRQTELIIKGVQSTQTVDETAVSGGQTTCRRAADLHAAVDVHQICSYAELF